MTAGDGRVVEGTYQDQIDGDLGAIDPMHHAIHEEIAYHASYYAASVANGGTIIVRMTTGAKNCHVRCAVSAGVLAFGPFEILEGTTFTAPGTGMTAYNLDRNSDETSAVALYSDPTVNAAGTVLTKTIEGGVTDQDGGPAAAPEIILRPNTEYAFRLTNGSGAASMCAIALSWYERD